MRRKIAWAALVLCGLAVFGLDTSPSAEEAAARKKSADLESARVRITGLIAECENHLAADHAAVYEARLLEYESRSRPDGGAALDLRRRRERLERENQLRLIRLKAMAAEVEWRRRETGPPQVERGDR